LTRMEKAGFKAIFLTVDNTVRESDLCY